jgi:hypothetical protein
LVNQRAAQTDAALGRPASRRGELKQLLPIGFVYDPLDRVVLDPNQQVQQAIRVLLQTYRSDCNLFWQSPLAVLTPMEPLSC